MRQVHQVMLNFTDPELKDLYSALDARDFYGNVSAFSIDKLAARMMTVLRLYREGASAIVLGNPMDWNGGSTMEVADDGN